MSSKNSSPSIPAPYLQNWMHKRIEIPHESQDERLARYQSQHYWSQKLDYLLGTLFKFFHLNNERARWAVYKFYMTLKYFKYKMFNRIEVVGRDKIPPQGAIFIMNHWGKSDVVMFMSVLREPVGCFTAVGTGLLADILERFFNFVPRIGSGTVMIEKMVRTILKKSRYFAVWPEGTSSKKELVLEPFSGVIRVYATLNSTKDVIPIVPVVMQNTNSYLWHQTLPKLKKIRLTFLDPFYFPRDWLKKPEEGGKTPREMANYAMLKIARKVGQNKLSPNRVLNWRRKARKDNRHDWGH